MKCMKLISAGALLISLLISIGPSKAFAYPTLQLDISKGVYDSSTQTIVSTGSSFTLYAYIIPDRYNLLNDTYYVSAAIAPKVGTGGASLGSFVFNGSTINVTSGMTYGIPPLENIISLQGWDKGDLPRHGIYPTWFSEFGFGFNPNNRISAYNTQDRAVSGGTIDLAYNPYGAMYYAAFTVDTSLLAPGYLIHFDLYNTKLKSGVDVDISQFAPFSHDAESGDHRVPEPSTVLLLGAGLTLLFFFARMRRSRACSRR